MPIHSRVPAIFRRFLKWNVILVVVAAVLLIGLRMALPGLVQRRVNRVLDEMPDYDGHIGDVDIRLFEGAYEIEEIEIVKIEIVKTAADSVLRLEGGEVLRGMARAF